MSNNSSNSHPSPTNPSYVWEYEYYDDVSFENLKAHRYSIVIGFWVGLAVFVVFMFFILTLLTKTGAPHQEGHLCETRCHPASCLVSIGRSREPDGKASSRPLKEESHSLIHCFLHEEEPQEAGQEWFSSVEAQAYQRPKQEPHLLTHLTIPNSVNTEHSCALGNDDLLLHDLPEIMVNRNHHVC